MKSSIPEVALLNPAAYQRKNRKHQPSKESVNNEEMNKVMGKLEDNSFIKQTQVELKKYKEELDFVKQMLSKR
ncbi:MAG: hypothetical protein EOO01_18205 [Chitinophagaceae bacterium]|nr:MAG: hypothetical protein EOO01_18205 [Chitinophagaceae bacterium]